MRPEHTQRRHARVALAVVLAFAHTLALGCAEMSAGDCSDKGLCELADASVGPTAGGDSSFADVTPSPPDTSMPADGAVDAARDVVTDRAADVITDSAPDVTPDAVADAAPDVADSGPPPDGCACVPAAPAGWSGPVALAETTGNPLPPLASCSAPYASLAYDGHADPTAPAAQCACACGAATGVSCAAPTIDLHAGSACGLRCGGAQVPAGACTPVSTAGCGASITVRAAPAVPIGGSCPAQRTANVPAWRWGRAARACALPSPAVRGDCAVDTVCAPAPASPFSGHLCVTRAGDTACPGGSAYAVRHLYFEGADDGRGCSACTCAAPAGGACAGTFTTFNDTGCTLPTGTLALSASCSSAQIATAGLKASAPTPSGSTCAPSAVSPAGALVPITPATVCCLP